MNNTRNCSTCNKPIDLYAIKYHTADKQNVFCNAYCSNEWYQKKKENNYET